MKHVVNLIIIYEYDNTVYSTIEPYNNKNNRGCAIYLFSTSLYSTLCV